jgi:hypothetical protein
MEALMRAGCDIRAKDDDGETGRQIAETQGHMVVVARLDALEAEMLIDGGMSGCSGKKKRKKRPKKNKKKRKPAASAAEPEPDAQKPEPKPGLEPEPEPQPGPGPELEPDAQAPGEVTKHGRVDPDPVNLKCAACFLL